MWTLDSLQRQASALCALRVFFVGSVFQRVRRDRRVASLLAMTTVMFVVAIFSCQSTRNQKLGTRNLKLEPGSCTRHYEFKSVFICEHLWLLLHSPFPRPLDLLTP